MSLLDRARQAAVKQHEVGDNENEERYSKITQRPCSGCLDACPLSFPLLVLADVSFGERIQHRARPVVAPTLRFYANNTAA